MQVMCIIGLKTNGVLRGASKIYLDDSSENLLYKYYEFYLSHVMVSKQ